MSSTKKRVIQDLESAVASVEGGITDLEYAIQGTGDEIEELEETIVKLEKQLEVTADLNFISVLQNIRMYADNAIKRLENANEATSETPDSDSGIGSPGSG